MYFWNSVYAAYMIIMFVWFNCCFSGCCSLLLNPWSLQQKGQIAVQKSQRLRQVIVQNLNCKNNNKAKWTKKTTNILPLHSNSNAITGQSYSHLQNVRPKVSILSLWWGSIAIAVPQVCPPTLLSDPRFWGEAACQQCTTCRRAPSGGRKGNTPGFC